MMISPFSEWEPQAIVLCNGDYPSHPIPIQLLKGCNKVICCDGASDHFLAYEKRLPWRIIGDGDSVSEQTRQTCSELFIHVSEQETNDQTKAVRYLQSLGYRRIAILGATGKREDHTVGNISLLIDYLQLGLEVRMYTDYGVFLLPQRSQPLTHITIQAPIDSPISVWSFGARNLFASGLEYPLYDFSKWWQGTLNKTISSIVTIQAEGDFLVYMAYPQDENKS